MAQEALDWTRPAGYNSLPRKFNRPASPQYFPDYRFKGFPAGYMVEAHNPLRVQPSADVHDRHIDRYFGKGADEPAYQSPLPPLPPPAEERDNPEWLQSSQFLPPQLDDVNLPPLGSPKRDNPPPSPPRSPRRVVRDPLRELTTAERGKRIKEQEIADADLRDYRYKKELEKERQREEQKLNREDYERVQDNFPHTEREVVGIQEQEKRIQELKEDINRLKHVELEKERARSEPLTERSYRDRYGLNRYNTYSPRMTNHPLATSRDRGLRMQDYLSRTTYSSDFVNPKEQAPTRLPKPGTYPHQEPLIKEQRGGGGAPIKDDTGKLETRIRGRMNEILYAKPTGPKANVKYGDELREQADQQRVQKDLNEYDLKQPMMNLADLMHEGKLGYPRRDREGRILNHHLPHPVSNQDVPLPLYSPRDYHDFLDQQVIEKRKNQKLAEMEGKRQAVQHVQTFENNMFGKYGGGAPKGRDLRKKKLDYSIHHPSTSDERENY